MNRSTAFATHLAIVLGTAGCGNAGEDHSPEPVGDTSAALVTGGDERVTQGSVSHLYQTNAGYAYALPNGLTTNDIVAIDISKYDTVVAWDRHGQVHYGNSTDLGVGSSQAYTLPPGKGPGDLLAAGISKTDNKVYYYWTGKVRSVGTAVDTEAYSAPQSVVYPAGYDEKNLVDITITPDDSVHAFWKRPETPAVIRTVGNSLDISPPTGASSARPSNKTAHHIVGMGTSAAGVTYTWYEGNGIGRGHSTIEGDIDELVRDAMAAAGWPGATVAVAKEGRMVHQKGYGYANWDTKMHMLPQHRGRIGSTSKVITALGVMEQIETHGNGDFSVLDEPIYAANGGILGSSAYRNALAAGVSRYTPIVGIVIDRTTSQSIAYYDNGTFSKGNSSSLGAYASPAPYSIGQGYEPKDIAAMAMDLDGKIVTWFYDGRVFRSNSSGTVLAVNNMGEDYEAPHPLKRIVGIDIASNGNVYAWYEHGQLSIGTRTDLGSVDKYIPFTVPVGQSSWNIREVGIAPNDDHVYVWYGTNKKSSGVSTDLDHYSAPATYSVAAGVSPGYDYADWYDKVTLRNLMTHSAGFSDGPGKDFDAVALMFGVDVGDVTYAMLHQFFLRTYPMSYEPGTLYDYSNHGMGTAGLALSEMRNGQSVRNSLKSLVFDPLGISARDAQEPMTWRDAENHNMVENGSFEFVIEDYSSPVDGLGTAAGGWALSAPQFVRLILRTDRNNYRADFLTTATLDIMDTDVDGFNRSIGWGTGPGGGSGTYHEHGGDTAHGRAYIKRFSDDYTSANGTDLSNVIVAVQTPTGGDYGMKGLVDQIALLVGAASIPAFYDLYNEGNF